ncbi:MAG: hypothetical protein CMO30_19215 [Tistrella sp.]|uniref:Novel STAND NTPase 1 domain-containing protein n=2 Tax=Tistrella TaxID=171436 RepID=A0A3B9ITY3_9PROT|nr:hypothetical protein [Tistrella sp.]MBA77404.1 hypothetical protein [Tistrella sp.]HAE51341.1 hypothetical protein [Tistrella mobilis]
MFFGREREIEELVDRIQSERLTVLFGMSGRGKTSLLQAGVLPKLKDAGARPVRLRLNPEDDRGFVEQLRRGWEAASDGIQEDASLWERGHRRDAMGALSQAPPVLILDQFEELFTSDGRRDGQLSELFEELACLVENRVPKNLRTRLAEDRGFGDIFTDRPTPARVVIALREDFLAHLEAWSGLFPSVMRNRMRLTLLTGTQALDAVLLPARIGPTPLMDARTADAIVRSVAGCDESISLSQIQVDPSLLSLLCQELNERRIRGARQEITLEDAQERQNDILQDFYERCFEDISSQIRDVVESTLLVSEGGHRNFCAEVDFIGAVCKSGISAEQARTAIGSLLRTRLLSAQYFAGARRLELTHDRLVELVQSSRQIREQTRHLNAKIEGIEVEKSKLIRMIDIYKITVFIFIVIAFGALLLWRSENRAAKALGIAEKSVDEMLTIIEKPEMDQVHGFYRIEPDLLKHLVTAEKQLHEAGTDLNSPTSILRRARVSLREANLLILSGRERRAVPLYINVLERTDKLSVGDIQSIKEVQFEALYYLMTYNTIEDLGSLIYGKYSKFGRDLHNEHFVGKAGQWRLRYAAQIIREDCREGALDSAQYVLDQARDAARGLDHVYLGEILEITILDAYLKDCFENLTDQKLYEYRKQLSILTHRYFQNYPRSMTAAEYMIDILFGDMDDYSAISGRSGFETVAKSIMEISGRFVDSKPMVFEAAQAQLHVMRARFHLDIDQNADLALEEAKAAVKMYDDLGQAGSATIPKFDQSKTAKSIRDEAERQLGQGRPED